MNSALELPSIAFFGRSLAEYARFFAFNPDDLSGRTILDVAAGPSSFAAEASCRRLSVVAADPLYGLQGEVLAQMVALDYARMFAQMRKHTSLLRFQTFASIDEAEKDRRAAAAHFLEDYPAGFAVGRYVGAKLPALPFATGQFDLVLCAHLLFLYSGQLDYAFHLAACRELCRVSRGEVRIHPIVELDGKGYRYFERLRDDLAILCISTEILEVDHAFFAGSNRTLVLRGEKTSSTD